MTVTAVMLLLLTGCEASEINTRIYSTIIGNEYYLLFLKGLLTTVEVMILSTIVALIFGVLLYAWYYSRNRVGVAVFNFLIRFITLTPVNVWFYLCLYIFVAVSDISSITVAVFALGTLFGVRFAKIVYEEILNVEPKEIDVATSMGYSRFNALIRLFIPQHIPGIVYFTKEAIKDTVKDSALIGMLSVYDFQHMADMVTEETGETIITAILSVIVYAFLAWGFSRIIERIGSNLSFAKEKSPEEIKKRILRGKI